MPLSTWRHKDGENSKKTNEMQLISESEDSPFKQLSIKYNVTEAQFLLKWAYIYRTWIFKYLLKKY